LSHDYQRSVEITRTKSDGFLFSISKFVTRDDTGLAAGDDLRHLRRFTNSDGVASVDAELVAAGGQQVGGRVRRTDDCRLLDTNPAGSSHLASLDDVLQQWTPAVRRRTFPAQRHAVVGLLDDAWISRPRRRLCDHNHITIISSVQFVTLLKQEVKVI